MEASISGNLFLRTLAPLVIGLLLAIVLGSQIGEGALALPLAFVALLVLGSFYLLFFRATRLEAIAVGLLIIGYIVGNRGFAQISLTGATPIYLGEAGLALCAALMLARMTLQRERLLPETPLGWAVFAFLVVGGVRLFLDAVVKVNHVSPLTAIRDSATVYYAFFFLVAYRLGSAPGSRRVVERCLWIACLLLPAVVIASIAIPELLWTFRVRGVPVILHKYDLTTAYLAFASIYFFLGAAQGKYRILRLTCSVVYLCLMLMIVTRAALVGLACATLLLIAARQFRFLFLQALMLVAAAFTITTLQVVDTGGQSFLEPLADKVTSMTDVSGNKTYRGQFGETASANNQWRLTWWKNVFNDTISKAPFFGLGFGYDLASEFVREYYGNRHGGFETRSPHSIWVTVFGRMGILGLISFTVVAFLICREAVAAARRVARRQAPPASLGHWCAVLILLGSASFGVVLEGPMGGVVFWTFLGLAVSGTPPPPMQAEPEPLPEITRQRFVRRELVPAALRQARG